jgi:hypothetical protein
MRAPQYRHVGAGPDRGRRRKSEMDHGAPMRTCRACGCTDDDCRQCVEKTGEPCYWVEPDLCSACRPSRAEGVPGFWLYETSGALRPAVVAYLQHDEMTPGEIAAMRAYLRQWIGAFVGVDDLVGRVEGLDSRQKIGAWLDDALLMGIDPL